MMLKHCKYCGEDKPYDPSIKPASKATGFHGASCWDCFVAKDRVRSKIAAQQLVVDPLTGETVTYGAAKYRKVVVDPKTNEQVRTGALNQRRKAETPEGRAYFIQAEYKRIAKRKARPICAWNDEAKSRAIRAQTDQLTYTTGLAHHTDHIVPQFGETVSGLECHHNLRPLLASTNGSKSNKWDVDKDSIECHEYHLKMFKTNF